MFYREREIFVDCTTAVMVIMESADRRGVYTSGLGAADFR